VSNDTPPNPVTEIVGSDHVARIVQILTAALSASVFICIAQRLGAYFIADHHLAAGQLVDWPEIWWGCIPLALTMLWTAKNSVDEFRAFGKPPSPVFSLGTTVLFSTCAYVALATAGSLLFDGMKAIWALAVFFAICSLWSLASAWRHASQESAKRDRRKLRERFEWSLAYPICAGSLAYYAHHNGEGWTALLPLVPAVYFVRDAWNLKTFSTKSEGTTGA